METMKDFLILIIDHIQVCLLHGFVCLCISIVYVWCRYIAHFVTLAVGVYFSGDGAMRDKDGHYQITGRVDDVINTKGHRLGTAELESVMVCVILCCECVYVLVFTFCATCLSQDEDHRVAETAVVGYGHEDYGEGIVAMLLITVYITVV